MSEKVYVDWGKLLQIVIIAVATVTLALAGVISSDTASLFIGSGVGYVFGNGKSVRNGHGPAPMIGLRRLRPLPEDELPDA